MEVFAEFLVGAPVEERHGWADHVPIFIDEDGSVQLRAETDPLDLFAGNAVVLEKFFCTAADGVPPFVGVLFVALAVVCRGVVGPIYGGAHEFNLVGYVREGRFNKGRAYVVCYQIHCSILYKTFVSSPIQ